jgi:hypothetical protein
MESPKPASRRTSRQKIIDLEAKQVEAGASVNPTMAAPGDAAGPADEGQSEVDQAARESIEAASRRSANPAVGAAATSPAAETTATEKAKPLEKSVANRGMAGSVGAGVAGGAAAIGIAALLNLAGLVSIVPGSLREQVVTQDNALQTEVDRLKDTIAGLEARFAVQPDDSFSQAVADVQGRMTSTEKAVADMQGQIAGLQTASREVATLAAKVDQLGKSASAGAPTSIAADTNESAAVSAFEEKLASEAGKLAASIQVLEARISAVEASVAAVTDANSQNSSAGTDAARILAAASIEAAVADGKPFAEMLGPVEALIGSGPAIDRLREFASAGIATNAQLLAAFDSVRGQILSLSSEPAAGFFEKLVDNAKGLVKVEPAGPVPGNSPEAILSRVKAWVAAGDPASALTAWQTLPEAQKAAGTSFAEMLARRVEADKALAEVLASLGPSGQD